MPSPRTWSISGARPSGWASGDTHQSPRPARSSRRPPNHPSSSTKRSTPTARRPLGEADERVEVVVEVHRFPRVEHDGARARAGGAARRTTAWNCRLAASSPAGRVDGDTPTASRTTRRAPSTTSPGCSSSPSCSSGAAVGEPLGGRPRLLPLHARWAPHTSPRCSPKPAVPTHSTAGSRATCGHGGSRRRTRPSPNARRGEDGTRGTNDRANVSSSVAWAGTGDGDSTARRARSRRRRRWSSVTSIRTRAAGIDARSRCSRRSPATSSVDSTTSRSPARRRAPGVKRGAHAVPSARRPSSPGDRGSPTRARARARPARRRRGCRRSGGSARRRRGGRGRARRRRRTEIAAPQCDDARRRRPDGSTHEARCCRRDVDEAPRRIIRDVSPCRAERQPADELSLQDQVHGEGREGDEHRAGGDEVVVGEELAPEVGERRRDRPVGALVLAAARPRRSR